MSNVLGLPSADQFQEQNDILKSIASKVGVHDVVNSWKEVQAIVRRNQGKRYFKEGDQFFAEFDDTIHIWEAVRVEDDALTIQSRDCLLNAQFSAPQALYKVKTDPLSAGTYHVTISEVKYQFTTTVSIPVGGIITFPWAYNTDILTTKPQTFSSQLSTAALETMSISAGSGGTELTGLNHIDRCRYGSNNYKESALRQWLNSDLSNWSWTAQTDYDRPSNYGDSRGFIKRLDPELVAVIGETANKVARNTITDGGGQDTVTDKVFLLSQKEVGLGTEGDTTGEIVYPYYDGVTNADRIKLLANSPRYWWLRSPYTGYSYYVRYVSTAGALHSSHAYYSHGVAPACRIR